MTKTIDYALDKDGIAMLTIDVPGHSMNVLTAGFMSELDGLIDKIAGDDKIKGAIITSGKETFVAGADLAMINQMVALAKKGNAALIDVRVPPDELPVARGRKRTGKRVLTVGTDCAVGKKYSALALHREFEERGIKADFRATGQTGIFIAGEGIPIDAVVADFVSGAAEVLSPDNDIDHWDIIEGQGALLHPSYGGVSLALLHGSQPDALILCHDAERDDLLGLEGDFAVPPLDQVADLALTCARITNPNCIWAGISVNTSMYSEEQRQSYLNSTEETFGVPCLDPVATGMTRIADFLLENVR